MTEWIAGLVDSRYTIENQLASNAYFGDLLQGFDEQKQCAVLLHRLSPLVVSFIGQEQIQLRARLYQVPNLPMMRVQEVYTATEGTFVVYDMIENAMPLLSYIEGKPLPLVLEVLQNLCEALAGLHDRTMWHGGLVPEYIWVLPSGEVRLLTMPTDSPLSLFNANGQGLPIQFFAPETMAMSPFDARTDIYNLGVLFYLVLTGRYPFEQEQDDTLYAPSRFNPHIPPQLDRLILKMINKRPTKRIQWIGQTIDELMRMLGRNEFLCKLDRQTFGSQQLFSAEFTGRGDELTTMSAFYEKMIVGGRHTMLITGKQGVGRRRLIYEASGRYMYKVSGISSTVREQPFSAVEGVAMKLIMLCFVVPNLEAIAKAYLKPLSKILPRVAYEYKDMLNDCLDGEDDRSESESLLFQFFTEVLESYEDPLVLELYEAHLLDGDSIQFFKRLMQNEAIGLGLIAVAEEMTPQLLSLFQNHMQVNPLPFEQMRDCVMSRFGDADFLSEEFIQWLNHHARGSLGTVFQLIEYLADTSQIYLQRYVWHMVPSSVEKLNIPESMESLILYRLEQLPPQTKAVCQVASLFKGLFMNEAIAKAADIGSVQELLQVMHSLEEQGLLLQAHSLYRFPSNNVKTHIYQSIPEEERRALHRKLATCLWEAGSQEYREIAHHFESGEQWERAIYLYIKGARNCLSRNLLAEAESQIASAIKLYEQVPGRVCPKSLYTFRAKLLRMAGHLDAAAAVYQDLYERTGSLSVFTVLMMIYGTLCSFHMIEPHLPFIREKVVAEDTPQKQRMQLMAVRGLYALEHGDYAVIRELEEYQHANGAKLREEMRIRDYINWLNNLVVLLTNMPNVPWEQRSRYLQEAATLAEHYNVRSQLIGIYNLMAIGFQETEPLKAKDYYLQSAKLAADLGDKSKEVIAYNNLAEIYRLLGDMYHAHAYIEKAREVGTAVQQYDDAFLLQSEIEHFLFIEDYLKAEQVISSLIVISKITGQRKMRDLAFLYQFRSYVEQGNKRRATRMWPIVERICLNRKFIIELQFSRI
ncbi:MAG: ATP-binding protein, partial [Tumebacillaceae bacterium]